jgi:hypothetical protein
LGIHLYGGGEGALSRVDAYYLVFHTPGRQARAQGGCACSV